MCFVKKPKVIQEATAAPASAPSSVPQQTEAETTLNKVKKSQGKNSLTIKPSSTGTGLNI